MNLRPVVSTIATVGLVTLITCAAPRVALAQTTPPGPPVETGSTQELAKKLVNPLTDLVSIPFQFNWLNNVGPEKELRTVMYIQPVVPMSISERWNVIGRWVTPYISQPSAFGGSSGLGDVMAQAFFSPKSKSTFSWGVGPMFNLPITTDPALGLGKWAAGPAVAVMKQNGGMTYGMLVNNIWSFASTGKTVRPDVNMGYFQPTIAHTSHGGVTVVLNTETVADWNAANKDDRWSVPVNMAVSKLTKFGSMPMSMQVGGGYYIVKPSYGPSWQLRTTFTLLMPRAK
jgi:hypothetical protein